MFEGLQKHWGVLREAWKQENEGKARRRLIEEKDFLPAALEILETPASPVGRGIVWAIVIFFVIALVWSIVGRVDMVVTAPGRLVPTERVKLIQPAEIGVVRAIHVSDGQHVNQGDVLVELDPTVSTAEIEQVTRALSIARIKAARGQALLEYVQGRAPVFAPPEGLAQSEALMQERLIDSRVREYEASLSALQRQYDERRADSAISEQELSRLEATLPLIKEQVDARLELVEMGLNPRLTFLELQERYVNHQQSIEIQRGQRAKVAAAIATVERQIEQVRQEFRRGVIVELAEAQDDISLQEQELTKVRQRGVQQQLRAPIDGVVQQLSIHTIGGVVQPVEPVMVLVPENQVLLVEAMVLNKDIGFVEVGDEVAVKLEAFPFTKYGSVPGRLENLSLDAIQNEDLGLVYQALVSIEQSDIRVGSREVPLAPGMAATVEIKTGERRLIEFFLSPLLRYKSEALRER